jgi:TonB-dependent receptor
MALNKSRVSLVALACGVSVVALSAAAYAQSNDQMETVVVTGIRASLHSSQEIKQNASGVVDAITAEDIGKFPDTNLAESIQRIPGVTIDRNNGEGARVTVRGFGPEYNLVTLNGRSMPGAINANTQSATRSFDFANLASDSIAGITVTKTGQANVPSGGIGSTINIKTARPFDHPGLVITGTGKMAYDTTNRVGDDYTPNISGLVSDTFFGDRLGILVSGSYAVRNSALESATNGGWLLVQHRRPHNAQVDPDVLETQINTGVVTSTNANPEENVWAPRSLGFGYQEDQRVRTNAQAVVQWKPQDSVTATFDFTYALFKDHQTQHTFGLWYEYGSNFFSGTVNEHGTMTDVEDVASDMSYSTFDDQIRNELTSVGLNLNWEASDNVTVSFDAHHSLMMSGGDPRGNNTFGIQGQTPSIMTPGMSKYYKTGDKEIPLGWFDFAAPYTKDTLTTSTISPLFYQSNNNVFNTSIDEARLDSVWRNTNRGLTSIQFGIEVKKMKTRAAAWNSFIGTGYYNAADAGLVPASAYRKVSTCGLLTSFSGGGCDIATAPSYFEYDLDAFVKATQTRYSYAPNGIYPPSVPTNDDHIQEVTKAIYGQMNFDLDLFDRPLKMTTGLRYEQVDVTAQSLQKIATAISWDNPTEWHTLYANSATFSKVKAHNYEFLPNIDISYEALENVLVRTSFSKTNTRSNLPQMVGTTSVGQAPKPLSRPATAGNPGLLPYESYNFDATVEWYYGVDSYVSMNYFSKDVVNFLTNTTTKVAINNITDPYQGAWKAAAVSALNSGGNPMPTDEQIFAQLRLMHPEIPTTQGFASQPGDPLAMFDLTVPTNANKVNIHGFEFAWQHTFGDSGFGVQASWSIPLGGAKWNPLTVETQFALPGLSKSYGLMAYYEKYGFQGRIAFTHRDSFLAGIGQAQAANEPTYTAPYNQVDASASYDITDNISVVWDGINLTGEGIKQYGRYREQFLGAYQGGARFEFGVHVKY